jgi:uncharacterized protein YjbI with pentapeptide repeats
MKRPLIPPVLTEMTLDTLKTAANISEARVVGSRLTGVAANSIGFERMVLEDTEISSSRLKKSSFEDVLLSRCLVFGTDFDSSGWRRVRFDQGIASGMALSGSTVRDVCFDRAKLNLANFRDARLIDVSFVDCDLTEADFQSAGMKKVRFLNCVMEGVDFSGCKMSEVDLTSSDIGTIRGVMSLRGAKMDAAQLISLSPAFAVEIGIEVKAFGE